MVHGKHGSGKFKVLYTSTSQALAHHSFLPIRHICETFSRAIITARILPITARIGILFVHTFILLSKLNECFTNVTTTGVLRGEGPSTVYCYWSTRRSHPLHCARQFVESLRSRPYKQLQYTTWAIICLNVYTQLPKTEEFFSHHL